MKKLLFLLLAICLIGFLAGCDDGGSGSDDNGGNGNGGGNGDNGGGDIAPNISTYVLTDHTNAGYIGGVTQIAGGINGTLAMGGDEVNLLETITLNYDDNTFTWYRKTENITNSTTDDNSTYSGPMVLNGSTLTLTVNKQKNNETSVETAFGPLDNDFTVTANTIENDMGGIYTKQ